jgi:hypothetical protein
VNLQVFRGEQFPLSLLLLLLLQMIKGFKDEGVMQICSARRARITKYRSYKARVSGSVLPGKYFLRIFPSVRIKNMYLFRSLCSGKYKGSVRQRQPLPVIRTSSYVCAGSSNFR